MILQYQQLVGKPFAWGKQDCLACLRQFFADNFDIKIRNYARPTDWSSDKVDLIRMLYEREGFEQITDWKFKDLRPADVLCISIGESNPNHFAINVGDNTIVHHIYGRMSNAEPLRDFWRNHTAFLIRHKDVPDLRPTFPDVDIMEILHARNAAPTE